MERRICHQECLLPLLISVVLGISGCKSPQDFKAQADEEAYRILEQKWQPEHGVQANYRIQDVPPGPNDIYLDPNWLPSGILTVADAVAIATTRNREYQSRKETLYKSALDLTLFRHDYARQWFGTIDGGYTATESDESVDAGGQVGFDQLLADGTQISTAIAVDWFRYLTGDPDTSLSSVLTAGVTKPLLRGSTREVVTENLTQAERSVLYNIRSFSRYRKEFVVSIVSQYLRTLQSLDGVRNAESNYASLTLAYEEAAMKAEAGKLRPLEADQTKQQMLQARDSLARAQRLYQQALDEFKLTLAVPIEISMELDPAILGELAAMEIEEPNFPVDDAVRTALVTRLDLATSHDQVEDAERKIVVTADALRAQLDLSVSASVDSEEKTDWYKLEFGEGTYAAGLAMDLPLDKKTEGAAYRKALIALMEARRDYEEAADGVKLDVRNAYRSLIEAARRYQIQKISLELARERVSSTRMLLQAGRAQARDLLEAQDSLLSAQNETTSTLVNFMLARLAFYRDIGILTIKPDGLWESLEITEQKLL